MGKNNTAQFTVYMTPTLAEATRYAAELRACSVSEYLKSLVVLDQENASHAAERDRQDLRYVRTGVDALLDELWQLRQPPPLTYRSASEKSLKQLVREVHAKRVGGTSDAN